MAYIETALEKLRGGDAAGFSQLLDEHPEVIDEKDAAGLSLLMHCLYTGRADLAGLVADRMPCLDIFAATSLGRMDVVDTLLAQDPSLANAAAADGFRPLHLAAFFGGSEVMGRLIDAGADIGKATDNAMQVLPLNSAVAAGREDCVRALLAAGADVNAPQQQNITPLMGAAAGGREAILKLLLKHGADKTRTSDDGHSAADYARQRGHEALLAFL